MLKVLLRLALLAALLAGLIIAYQFFRSNDFPTTADNAAALVANWLPKEHSGEDQTYVAFASVLEAALAGQETSVETAATTSPTYPENVVIPIDTPKTEELAAPPSGNLGDAIVNLVCEQKTREFKKRMSGTGFFVSQRGVILTNAHVAQFLLLKGIEDQGKVECSASTGAEGADAYDIELLYISPTWLLNHASLINDINPKGSGENDFALLYVTKKTDGSSVSGNFAYLPPATSPVSKDLKGETVILVGYPRPGEARAERTTATTTVRGVFTFDSGFADIISLEESPLGYSGASGGPVIDRLGRAIGVIVTKSSGSTILNAIALAHVDRSIKSESGSDLLSMLNGDLDAQAVLFRTTISPILQEVLSRNLDQ